MVPEIFTNGGMMARTAVFPAQLKDGPGMPLGYQVGMRQRV
jgi:hypothetical protein